MFRGLVSQAGLKSEQPIYVGVGANDGVTSDWCADVLHANHKWTGVLIEPVPYLFRKLESNFGSGRFALENVAIGTQPGKASFYYLAPRALTEYGLPAWTEGLGSFRYEHLARHLAKLNVDLEPFIVETSVQVDTLADVVERNKLPHITFLHIDTEGHDYEVWKSLGGVVPDLLLIEHEHVKDKENMAAELLKGYDLFDCGSDYAGVRR